LNEARVLHGAEISRGLAWLSRAAVKFTQVQSAMTLIGATTA
jgi:hypothetical protein